MIDALRPQMRLLIPIWRYAVNMLNAWQLVLRHLVFGRCGALWMRRLPVVWV